MDEDGIMISLLFIAAVAAFYFLLIFPALYHDEMHFMAKATDSFQQTEFNGEVEVEHYDDYGLFHKYVEMLNSGELQMYEATAGSSAEEMVTIRERTASDDRIYGSFERNQQTITEKLGNCERLRWDRLETVDLVMVDDSATGKKKGGTVLAHYSVTNNRIYILSSATEKSDAELDSIIVHELTHVLTAGEGGDKLLHEGLAEAIAHFITGKAVGDSYTIPYCLIAITLESQGLDKTVMYIEEDFMKLFFDQNVMVGGYDHLLSISNKYADGECSKIEVLAAWDLLCHYAVVKNAQNVMLEFKMPRGASEECQQYLKNVLLQKQIKP